jgi:hypothetical protein
MAWTIKIAFRTARNREEKKLMGRCISKGFSASVFLNNNQSATELFNTYIHELTHAYIHRLEAKFTDESEEATCRKVANAAEQALGEFFRLK